MIGDIDIKENMQLNDKFDSPIFTPSTKAAVGDKDQNISLSEMYEIIGRMSQSILRIRVLNCIIMHMNMPCQKA